MAPWGLLALVGLVLLVALLELDCAHVGQFMLSRPIVLGPALGFLCGDMERGMRLGALIEMFCLDQPPLGSLIPLNASVAAGSAALLCFGPQGLHESLALPIGLAAGWGHTSLEARVRSWRGRMAGEALLTLESGGRIPWGRFLGRALGLQTAMTALFLSGVVVLAGPLGSWVWSAGPPALRDGLRGAYHLAALPVGIVSLAGALWRRRPWT